MNQRLTSLNPCLRWRAFALLIAGPLLLSGCATREQNPNSPRPNTGYVDFYTDSSLDLSWEVKRFENLGDTPHTVFSKFEPVPGTVLRLASPPGDQRLQVWFINRVTQGPQSVLVHVENGKVTPVHVVLTPAGTTRVDQETQAVRGSAKGYGRRKTFTTEVNHVYEIAATAQAARDYRPKEQMPYWSVPKE